MISDANLKHTEFATDDALAAFIRYRYFLEEILEALGLAKGLIT